MTKCEHFEEAWIDLIDGQASTERQAAFERHLDSCPACRERFEAERDVLNAYRNLAPVASPAFSLDAALEPAPSPTSFPWRRTLLIAATLLVLSWAGAQWLLRSHLTPEERATRFLANLDQDEFQNALDVKEAFAPHLESVEDTGLIVQLHKSLSNQLVHVGDPSEALQVLRDLALHHDQEFDVPEALLKLGNQLVDSGRIFEAVRVFELAGSEFEQLQDATDRLIEQVLPFELDPKILEALGYLGY